MWLEFWWHRHRWTLSFLALALAAGLIVGDLTPAVMSLIPPVGHRSTFYIALLFAVIGALVILPFLVVRARMGLALLLGALAFLPSRAGMQWQIRGYAIVSATDVAVVVAAIVLVAHVKVVRGERLVPLVMRKPLSLWALVGVMGLVVAVLHGISWASYMPEIKGFYLWILIAVLSVNVVRSLWSLRLMLLILVVAAIPRVALQARDAASGSTGVTGVLANGDFVARTSGGAGDVNQFAFYIMVVFFVAIGLALAARGWRWRLAYYACAVAALVGLGFTFSRGAWLATVVGLVVLALAGGRRVLAGLLVAAVIGYFLVPPVIWARLTFSDSSVAERASFAQTATAVIRAYPLVGAGWGSNFYLTDKYLVPSDQPNDIPLWHNDYFAVATQVGLIGLVVFLWVWSTLAVAALRAYRRAPPGELRAYLLAMLAALAAMATQAFTENLFWHNETGPVLWLIAGLTCATINLVEQTRHRDAGPVGRRLLSSEAMASPYSEPATALPRGDPGWQSTPTGALDRQFPQELGASQPWSEDMAAKNRPLHVLAPGSPCDESCPYLRPDSLL